jgi:hypothetical protein
MPDKQIRLKGLTKLDRYELGEGEGIGYEEAELEGRAYGEVTVFTAMVTMALVSTVAAYLLRKHAGQSFEEDVEIIHPGGRIERRRVRWSAQSSEAPEPAIIRQIRGA